jgi:hypothetical protein
MPRFVGTILVGILAVLGGAAPAAAQSHPGCYPYCDYTHYYGPYDYRYIRPGLYCYPLCRLDGSCVPNPACVVQAPRGTVTVRSFAGPVSTTPTTASYYDPTVLPPYPPRRYRR